MNGERQGCQATCLFYTTKYLGGQRSAPHDVAEPDAAGRRRRGFGPTTQMNYGRLNMDEYLATADASVFVAVMIETVEALENIDAICAVPAARCRGLLLQKRVHRARSCTNRWRASTAS